MKALLLASLCLAAAACAVDQDDAPAVAQGDHFQYVVSALHVPSTSQEAQFEAFDFNNDRRFDNRLGQIFAMLADFNLGVGDTVREALQRGGIIMLADLQTTAFDKASASGFTTFLGTDPSPAPCTDPTRLDTCGQHLLGTGHFAVQPGSASDTSIAPIGSGVFVADVGVLPVELVIDNQSPPLRLDLHHARVRLVPIDANHISALFGGGIVRADIDNSIVPQARAQIDRVIRTECGHATGTLPCGCDSGSRADDLQSLFDANRDCQVSITEVASNTVTRNLLDTDLRLGGEELLSFGITAELVRATFAP